VSPIDDRRASRRGGLRLAIVASFGVLLVSVAPGAALAQNGQVAQIKLALLPVDQTGSFFDLTMRPGETRTIEVEIANDGIAALAARTYATDVYTIINGGFGGRLRGEPQTGATRWLTYPTAVLQLAAGTRTRRSPTVTVPSDAGPGEYIASLVLENDQPIPDGGDVGLDQIVRQAVAVVVTVPGRRSPGLAIGTAAQKVVAGKSVVSVAVANTGNVRLKPLVEFVLLDAAANRISQASIQMDTFYAHTSTFVEISLAALLLPGTYSVRLTLDDTAQDVRADGAGLEFIVAAPPEQATQPGLVPGLTGVSQGAAGGQMSFPTWAVAFLAGLLVAVALGLGVLARRRRGAAGPSG
jgi:hypothetical protein